MSDSNLQVSKSLGNRPVWVLNSFDKEYREVFRGEEIVVPPNNEKKVKMPFLAANRFLHQPVTPAELLRLPNGTYKGVPKALRIEELSDSDLRAEGKSVESLNKEAKEADNKAKLTCAICGVQSTSEKGLKIHTTKAHPEFEPVKDE